VQARPNPRRWLILDEVERTNPNHRIAHLGASRFGQSLGIRTHRRGLLGGSEPARETLRGALAP
jgi:hypothetical protein